MDKICNFDIVINTCLAEINPTSLMPDFDKNGFCYRSSTDLLTPAGGLREQNGRSCSQA